MPRKKLKKEQAVDAVSTESTSLQASGSTTNTVAIANSFDYAKRIAMLTPADKKRYAEISRSIDINNPSTVQMYGAELSQTISNNGKAILESVRSDNTSEVVQLANDLLAQLKLVDIDEINSSWVKRFCRNVPVLRKIVKSVDSIKIKYDTVASNVEAISKKIAASKIVAKRDNSSLETIFKNNVSYVENIRELIIAAKLKLQELDDDIAEKMGDPTMEAYMIQDMQTFRNSLSKRIADMETTEHLFLQDLFKIRATQGNNTAIIDKSDNIVNHVIPIWKSQLAISIILNNQKASIEAQQKLSNATNEMLVKNAEMLKMNSINVAKASEEQVITLDTLQKTTQDLIDTITEVKKIHEEGEQNRMKIESTLKEYGDHLLNSVQDNLLEK